MKALVTIVATAILAGAAYVFLMDRGGAPVETASQPESYVYQCATFNFSLIIPEGAGSVTVVPAQGAPFFRTVLVASRGVHARYEGGGMVLTGAGEEVTIQTESDTYICYPLPSATKAPWNWGDAGEGAATRPDLGRIIGESIVGLWKSTGDTSFERTFVVSGVLVDRFADGSIAEGTWDVLTDQSIGAPFPMDANTAYLRIAMHDAPEEALIYRVNALTPESLELVFLDGSGTVRFERVPEL